jgi:hypothetical protein
MQTDKPIETHWSTNANANTVSALKPTPAKVTSTSLSLITPISISSTSIPEPELTQHPAPHSPAPEEQQHQKTEHPGLSGRKLVVPDKIILSDGKTTKTVEFKDCEAIEYLKLCIGLHFCKEDGII